MSTTLAPPPPSTSTPPLSPSSVVVLADDRDVLGEGPVHDPRTGRLYRVDIEGKKVLSVDLTRAKARKEGETAPASAVVGETPEPVGCLCLTSDPKLLLVALSRSVYALDVTSGKLSESPLATLPESEGVEGLRFNDGKVSPGGTFVVGRLHARWRDGMKGAVYALRKRAPAAAAAGPDGAPGPDGSSPEKWALERVLGPEEVGMGNGMAWRPRRSRRGGEGAPGHAAGGGREGAEKEEEGEGEEGREALDFFVVDSAAKTVQRFDADPLTGIPVSGTGRTVLDAADFGGAVPDGMDVDGDGMLWVALAETGTVARFDPDARAAGRPLSRRATLRLPLTRVTSCAFGAAATGGGGDGAGGGGPDFSATLFVTSREEASKLREEASPVAGAVLLVADVVGAARVGRGEGERAISAGRPVPAVVEL